MPENNDSSLNWPKAGLAGVPDAEGSLTYTLPSHARQVPEDNDEIHEVDEESSSGDQSLPQTEGSPISEHEGQFTTQLNFGANPLGEDDAGFFSQPLFGDRPDTFSGSDQIAPSQANVITWPPLVRTRERPLWSRVGRSSFAIPVLLILVLALGAGGYKTYKHFTRATIVPAVSSSGIQPGQAVKVVNGPACRAGRTTTTVELAASRAENGNFYIATTGTVANGGSATLHGLSVHVLITYADGTQTTQSVPANKGQDIPGKSTKTWFGSATATDGSVPPVKVAISSVGASSPTLPACS